MHEIKKTQVEVELFKEGMQVQSKTIADLSSTISEHPDMKLTKGPKMIVESRSSQTEQQQRKEGSQTEELSGDHAEESEASMERCEKHGVKDNVGAQQSGQDGIIFMKSNGKSTLEETNTVKHGTGAISRRRNTIETMIERGHPVYRVIYRVFQKE